VATRYYPLVSFGHCVVCSSSIYGIRLPFGIFWPLCCLFFFYLRHLITLWYLLATVLSVLLLFTASDYPFGIFWPLCCLFFYLRHPITPLVSFGHCVVCSSSIYGIRLPLWYLLVTVLSVLLLFTPSDYPLVSFGLCVVCSSSIYGIRLPLYMNALLSLHKAFKHQSWYTNKCEDTKGVIGCRK
jgi:hypothetical protein